MLRRGPDRLRSSPYLRHIRSKPCLVCGDKAEAHHLNFAQPRAMGKKNGDQWTVPLCHHHHMEMHNSFLGERSWWASQGIAPHIWAEREYSNWKKEHADGDDDE
jgi:hypothetical protein